MSARRAIFDLLEKVVSLSPTTRWADKGVLGNDSTWGFRREMLSGSRQAGGGAGGLRLFLLLRVIKEKKLLVSLTSRVIDAM